MGNYTGGNLEAMDHLSRQFQQWSGQINDLNSQITAAVGTNVGTTWIGGVADRFKEQWDTQFQAALRNLADAMTGNADVIRSRRDAFNQAGNL